MSTVTPPRPAPARPGGPRPRAAPAATAATIDPFRVLRRHLVVIIASIVLGGVLGAGAFILLDQIYPLYTSEVLFEVQPGVQSAGEVATAQPLKEEFVHQIAMTQLVLLKSRDVLEIAVKNPDVQENTSWFRENFVDQNGNPLVQDAVDELEEDVRTGVMRDTQLFKVKWSAHDAKDVPIILNAIARAYIERREEIDKQIHIRNYEHFQRQLDRTNIDIRDLDEQIAQFIQEAGITTLDDPRYTHAAQAVQELTETMTGAQSALSIARTNYLQIAAKLEGTMEFGDDDVFEAEQDYSVTDHVRRVETMRVELRSLRGKYPSTHPQIRDGEAMLRAAEEEKKSKVEGIIRRNLNGRLKTHSQEIERFTTMLEELEQELEVKDTMLRELAGKQSVFEALQRRREHLETSRDGDLQLLKEIQLMRLREDAARVRLAEAAQTPRKKSFPLPEIIVPLGVLVTLALTVGLIFLRELTDQRVKSASDVGVLPGARVLGVVPDVSEDPTNCESAELALRRFPHSIVAESYRQVCTPLIKGIDRAGHRAIVVLGGLPGAGTTTAVSNLAAGLAFSGRRVLVVDANFRRPRLAEVMGVDPEHVGIGDVLAEDAMIEDAIFETEYGVTVMPAGTPPSRVIERLGSERFGSLVAELRNRYDIILFDAPPAVVAGDSLSLSSRLDAAILIVRANREQRGLVSRVINQIADTHCDLLGVVLNRPRGTAGGYFKKNFAVMAEYAGPSASAS